MAKQVKGGYRMKYCPFCGSGLQNAMAFCPKCGKRFLDAFENPETLGQLDIESNLPECPEVSTQGSASTQVVDDASKADSIPPKEPARKSIKRKTGLVLLSAIFVVAVIALIFFGKSDNESFQFLMQQILSFIWKFLMIRIM